MTRKGLRSIFFSSSKPSSPSDSSYGDSTTSQSTFSSSMMDENIEYAASIITKWDIDSSTYTKASSLFEGDRKEGKAFVKSVKDLQSAMHFLVSENSSSDKLIRSQELMQIAMKRLEKEFYQILSANRNFLDPESVSSRSSRESIRSSISSSSSEDDDASDEEDDKIRAAKNSISEVESVSDIVVADLKAIADCMISSGYGRECVRIYKIIRKSIVDESLYHLGVEKFNFSQINKMDWEVMELKIKHWLSAAKTAVKTLFNGERILCDHVFSANDKIADACFAEIATEGATTLLEFPELVAMTKRSPEKIFRTLDLYDTVSDLWPETESIFLSDSTAAVRSQALVSLAKLGDAVRVMLSEFEKAIQKEASRAVVPGGNVHPLTRYVMNYFSFLADYSGALSDIIADWPQPENSPMPESYFSSPTSGDGSTIAARLAWLILVVLCRLDGKAQLYKDVSLSYLFLANNLNYVVSKVRKSNLILLLGEEWCLKHEAKVIQYAANYERMGWSKVISSLPENLTTEISPSTASDCFKNFNHTFEEAYRKQTSWIVSDSKLRDEIKVSLAKKLVPLYSAFYEKYRMMFRREMGMESIVRYAPEDLGNYLSDLFYGAGVTGSTSWHSSSTASSPSRV